MARRVKLVTNEDVSSWTRWQRKYGWCSLSCSFPVKLKFWASGNGEVPFLYASYSKVEKTILAYFFFLIFPIYRTQCFSCGTEKLSWWTDCSKIPSRNCQNKKRHRSMRYLGNIRPKSFFADAEALPQLCTTGSQLWMLTDSSTGLSAWLGPTHRAPDLL